MKKLRSLKLLGLACVLAVALVFIGIEFVQAQVDTLGKPPDKEKPTLTLEDNDIITTESNALRVWRSIPGNGYECSWSTESPGYTSVAVGNVDDDSLREIVVPGSYEVKEGKGKSTDKYLKIFLNVYKQGETGIWQSTEDYDFIVEEVGYNHTEIMIADVDSDSNNEVIILTYHNLAVFKYDESDGRFKIVKRLTSIDLTGTDQSHFSAVTAGDIVNDEDNEILVSASSKNGDNGCVYILYGNLSPIIELPSVNAYLGSHSLRVANLDGDGTPEICSTGFSEYRPHDESLWQAYIFVWHKSNNGGWVLSETPIVGWEKAGDEAVNQYPYVYLDVGEVTNSPGDEIVVSSKYPEQYSPDYQLVLYEYEYNIENNVGDLVQIGETYVLHDQEDVFSVEIGDANSEIIVAGRTRLRRSPVFYLEVFDSEFKTIWKRIGERTEGWVFDTAINE